jgi:hypothetical protein
MLAPYSLFANGEYMEIHVYCQLLDSLVFDARIEETENSERQGRSGEGRRLANDVQGSNVRKVASAESENIHSGMGVNGCVTGAKIESPGATRQWNVSLFFMNCDMYW